MFDHTVQILRKSSAAVVVLLVIVTLGALFFGSIIYYLEGGIFTVNEQYPQGEYLRVSVDGYRHEISPFNSIPTSIYWAFTTSTSGMRCFDHAIPLIDS